MSDVSDVYDLDDLRASLAGEPAVAAELARRTDEVRDEYRTYRATLSELRKARALTQVQLAQSLNSSQPEVSRVERQTDLYLSTLRNYVRALGGQLAVAAAFQGGPSVWLRLADVTEQDELGPVDAGPVPVATRDTPPFDISDNHLSQVLDLNSRSASLRRAAEQALAAGAPNLAVAFNALAAETTANADVTADAASRAFGGAAAFASRQRKPRAAEVLFRRSLDLDLTNLRTRALLGQTLYHLGQYPEAIEHLTIAARVDNRSRLTLGWAHLQHGMQHNDETEAKAGCGHIVDALTTWAYNAPSSERSPWLKHVTRLAALRTYDDDVRGLVDFANGNAKWGPLDADALITGRAASASSTPTAELWEGSLADLP